MKQHNAKQAARDEKLVPSDDKVKIGKSNLRMDPSVTQKEETYQVVLDIIKNTPCYNTFFISADVPKIYMQEFWLTIKKVKKSSFYQCISLKHRIYSGDEHAEDEQVVVLISTTQKERHSLLQSTSSHSVSSNFGNQFINSPNASLISTIPENAEAEIKSLLDIQIQQDVPNIQQGPFHAVKVPVIPKTT
ncbi:hypothetical protein Tco_1458881 [Tanacetum coccineum]